MATDDFMPKDKPGYLGWHDTFKSGVTELGADPGATTDEIAAVYDDTSSARGHRGLAANGAAGFTGPKFPCSQQ